MALVDVPYEFMVYDMVYGMVYNIVYGMVYGMVYNIVYGMVYNIVYGMFYDMVYDIVYGVVYGIVYGIRTIWRTQLILFSSIALRSISSPFSVVWNKTIPMNSERYKCSARVCNWRNWASVIGPLGK